MDFDDVRSQAKEEASLQVQASAEQLQHEVERLKAEVAEAGCDGAAMCCMETTSSVRVHVLAGGRIASTDRRHGGAIFHS